MLIRRTDHLHAVRKPVLREAMANKILVIPYQSHFCTMCAVWCSYISTDLSSFLFATRCLHTLNLSAFCIWSRINSKLFFFLRLRTEFPSTESCPEKEGGAGLKQPHRNLGFTFPAKGSETVRKGERLSPAQTSPVPRRCLTGGPFNTVQNVLF